MKAKDLTLITGSAAAGILSGHHPGAGVILIGKHKLQAKRGLIDEFEAISTCCGGIILIQAAAILRRARAGQSVCLTCSNRIKSARRPRKQIKAPPFRARAMVELHNRRWGSDDMYSFIKKWRKGRWDAETR